jgi:glycosyltransferase involved in cell wall biosynthesis
MHTPSPITAVVLARNEEAMIGACLDTLRWCAATVVLDDGSSDNTSKIAESKGATVISFSHRSFARKREEALKRVKTEWVFYIDADERVTPTLAKEIMVHVETNAAAAFRILRTPIYFGTTLHHGGWESDFVTRVFQTAALQGWQGEVHESPVFTGSEITLKTPLVHLTHRDTVSGLYKTASWTPMEAAELYKAGVAPVTFWTLLRKGTMEFVRRIILKRGYKDGMVGLVEATIQAINRVLVYIQVWERQQKPPIEKRYQQIEAELQDAWLAESKSSRTGDEKPTHS